MSNLTLVAGLLRAGHSLDGIGDLAMDEARARELSAPQFEEATQALFCHRLDGKEIAALLRSPNSAVRGTAILECIDHPTPSRRRALRAAAPWALELPVNFTHSRSMRT